MNKTIKFDLSTKGVQEAQEKLARYVSAIKTVIIERFISVAFDWIIERASSRLASSGYDSRLVSDIALSFEKDVSGNYGILTLNHDKGAYLEFGVGIRGGSSPHPEASSVGWDYDVDSKYKRSDRSWSFYLDGGDIVDLREEDIDASREMSLGRIRYTTYGGEGSAFLYNAMMDLVTNGSAIKMLFERAIAESKAWI